MEQSGKAENLKGIEKYLQRKQNRRENKPKKLNGMSEWIAECDSKLSQRLCEITEDICKNEDIKLVRLVGPTCSGKTTAAKMLSQSFSKLGKRLHTISIDDFYFDTTMLQEMSREQGKDGIDYDSPDTIDMVELSRFVEEIFSSDVSHCPVFDFTEGKRAGYKEYRCSENDVFLFEGIQAMYPEISTIFSNLGHPSADISIAPQSSVQIGDVVFSPNELRLMRRLVRDANFRNTSAEFTFYLWGGVRENEEKFIFPYAKNCYYSIDSSMPYEPGILKPYLIKILAGLPAGSAYKCMSDEILAKIEGVMPIPSTLISEDSLYKEFV